MISRANQRQDIFLDDKDWKAYLSYLSECEVENRLREDESLSKVMEKLKRDLIKRAKKKYFITIDPVYSRAGPVSFLRA